jgi:hypothetical protein
VPSHLLPRWFLAYLIFNPKDKSETYLLNVGLNTSYTTLYLRRWQLSLKCFQQPLPDPLSMALSLLRNSFINVESIIILCNVCFSKFYRYFKFSDRTFMCISWFNHATCIKFLRSHFSSPFYLIFLSRPSNLFQFWKEFLIKMGVNVTNGSKYRLSFNAEC